MFLINVSLALAVLQKFVMHTQAMLQFYILFLSTFAMKIDEKNCTNS